MKRGINSIYHWASKKHIQNYIDEFSYCYNTKKLNDRERFAFFLNNLQGKLGLIL